MELVSVGHVESSLRDRDDAPKQGDEGAPEAWLVIAPEFVAALDGIATGDELLLFTWLDRGLRDVLQVRPRSRTTGPVQGVFSTRSPDRPNPIGLHRVTVLELDGGRVRVDQLEALDGTPIVDLKPLLRTIDER
jgi:tRNA-Thr(GGU) m(6)t(6)A37 methyltransferase TsaA